MPKKLGPHDELFTGYDGKWGASRINSSNLLNISIFSL